MRLLIGVVALTLFFSSDSQACRGRCGPGLGGRGNLFNPLLNPGLGGIGLNPGLNPGLGLNPSLNPGLNPGLGINPGLNPGIGFNPGLNPGIGFNPGINPGFRPGVTPRDPSLGSLGVNPIPGPQVNPNAPGLGLGFQGGIGGAGQPPSLGTPQGPQLNPNATPLPRGFGRSIGNVTEMVGKVGRGCTGTQVSPPGKRRIMVSAAHCGGDSVEINGQREPAQCFRNRDWQSFAWNDLQVCISTQPTSSNSNFGCLNMQNEVQIGAGVQFFGFGNPIIGQPILNTLKPGQTRVESMQADGAIIAFGQNSVTPGDSGGPVFDANGLIVGVNSKMIQSGNQFRSAFASIARNRPFFERVINNLGPQFGGDLQICGVNYVPGQNPANPSPPLAGGGPGAGSGGVPTRAQFTSASPYGVSGIGSRSFLTHLP